MEDVSLHSYQYQDLQKATVGESDIRLVTLRRGSLAEEDVTVRIHRTKLARPEPEYEALSYVWGTTEDPAAVSVESGGTISVTRNLSDALRGLRREDRDRTLWVDAICINQDNVGERNHQVMHMSPIYASASRVVIWLGKEADDSTYLLDKLTRFGATVEMDWRHASVLGHGPVDEFFPEPERCRVDSALVKLLSRPWFRRVWIRQEVASAKKATLACGGSTWPWIDFEAAVHFFHLSNLAWVPLDEQLADRVHLIYLVHKLSTMTHGDTPRTRYDLYLLRHQLYGVEATDPRDKIFALWNPLQKSHSEIDIPLDYNISAARLMTTIASRAFGSGGMESCAELLGQCFLKENEDSSLPSWCPDYTTDLPWRTPFWVEKASSYSHADVSLISMHHDDGPDMTQPKLRIAGREVAVVQDLFPFPDVTWGQAFNIMPGWFSGALSFLEGAETFLRSYPTKHERIYALSMATMAIYPMCYCPDEMQWESQEDVLGPIEEIEFISTQMAEGSKLDTEDPWVNCLLGRAARAMIGRSLYVDDGGHIGLAPQTTAPGDKICCMLGCHCPIALRPSTSPEGTFTIVGPCCSTDLRTGEAFLGPLPPDAAARVAPDRYYFEFCWRGGASSPTHEHTRLDPRILKMKADGVDLGIDYTGQQNPFLTREILAEAGIDVTDFIII